MKNTLLVSTATLARLLPMPVKQALYRIKPLARLIRRGLNRAAPQGTILVKVAAGELSGFRMWLDLQSEKDYWLGTYEPELQQAVCELVAPGMVAYDVGANIGYISLILAKAVGATGRVYAFEALPANQERLRQNLAANEAGAQVTLIPAAVVGQAGEVGFWVGPTGGMGKADGSAGRKEIAYTERIRVPGTSLDEFIYVEIHPIPQIVKIDIEGGEVLAFPGMQRLIAEARPLILLELHGQEAARTAWEALVGASYTLCQMQPGYPPIPALEALDWKAYVVGFPASPRS